MTIVDVVARGECLGHGQRVGRVALHAQRERAQAAQHEEAVERAGHGADRVLQELQPFEEILARRGQDATDGVRVAGQVLGRGVEDDVGAQRQRLLDERRCERVVDDQDGLLAACPVCCREPVGDRSDVDHAQVRVGGRLQPDEAGG